MLKYTEGFVGTSIVPSALTLSVKTRRDMRGFGNSCFVDVIDKDKYDISGFSCSVWTLVVRGVMANVWKYYSSLLRGHYIWEHSVRHGWMWVLWMKRLPKWDVSDSSVGHTNHISSVQCLTQPALSSSWTILYLNVCSISVQHRVFCIAMQGAVAQW